MLTLLGAVGCALVLLTACVEYEDPSFAPVTGKVKHTQLALSASSSNATTRMSADITQAIEQNNGSHFRGISDLFLLPFRVTQTGKDCIDGEDVPMGSQVLADQPTILNTSLNYGPNSKYYFDVLIPIGTNAFLVYGRATPPSDINESTNPIAFRQKNGRLAVEGLSSSGMQPENVVFKPVPMVSNISSGQAVSSKGEAIITYLNNIFQAQEGVFDWSSTDYPALNAIYDVVKAMKAGSSASVIAFVQEVYDAIKNSADAAGVSAVLNAIKNSTYVTLSADDKLAFKQDYTGYPTDDTGLPEGAAAIIWNNTQFEAVTTPNNIGALNVDVNNFAYPAELYYRANSRIHTSDVKITDAEAQAESIFVTNHASWGNVSENVDNTTVLNQAGSNQTEKLFTSDGMVYNTTTVVAITDPLQYAVSRLDLKLTANGETLVDNADVPNYIPVNSLEITGVLVGQQSPVDYLFHSTWAAEGNHPLYTIYDSQIDVDASAIATSSQFTHTLVLETLKDQAVNIAVELKNNSDKDIVTGTDKQIVPPGCKFYLVGQLVIKSEDGNGGYTYIENYSETDPAKNRVFCQDHVTQVTFTVSDLTKAYYVIPPLSSTKLEFSLAVANWKISTSVGHELEYNED